MHEVVAPLLMVIEQEVEFCSREERRNNDNNNGLLSCLSSSSYIENDVYSLFNQV